MEGGFSAGAGAEAEVIETGTVETGASLGAGEVSGGELTTEASAESKFSGYEDFDMEGESEGEDQQQEENQDAEYKSDAVDFLLQSEWFSEEEAVEFQAEIEQYSELARQNGVSPEAFNNLVNHFLVAQMEEYAEEVETKEKEVENSLQNLKKELTLSERQSWKPMRAELVGLVGNEKAKTIMLDADLYRAFLSVKQGGAKTEPLIKPVQVKKMSYEQVMDKRTDELRQNIGKDDKVAEIFKRYETEYPEYFKK